MMQRLQTLIEYKITDSTTNSQHNDVGMIGQQWVQFSNPFVNPRTSFTFLSFFLWDSLWTNNAELLKTIKNKQK